MKREHWGSRIGLVLAVAGNAVGLGNFLRFPVQAAKHGGGAFMIPYFFAFLLLGIPLMWVEWTVGRFGGAKGHGTTPGMFDEMWKHPVSKYIGSIGVLLPLMIGIYYVYVMTWSLGYAIYSLFGKMNFSAFAQAKEFFNGYIGVAQNSYFHNIIPAYIFYLVGFALTVWVIMRGVSGGIEKLAKIAMPTLFIFAILLVVRVLTIGTPDPVHHPSWNINNGLGFMWNPRFDTLLDGSTWLAAAGQIFFTLSLGIGAIQCYASYVKEHEDIALAGLTTASTNEFAEVILGGTIAIPAAYAFFGPEISKIAGTFDLGFKTLPLVFAKIPLGNIFSALWFLLLFFAGITSSVALAQPPVAFLEDEFGLDRKKASLIVGIILFVFSQPVIFFLSHGFLDEIDWWMGTFGLAFFATLEIFIFNFAFGTKRGWEELHKGAQIKVPGIFYYIIRYITPLFLTFIFLYWALTDGKAKLLMEGVSATDRPYIILARVIILLFLVAGIVLVKIAWDRKQRGKEVDL